MPATLTQNGAVFYRGPSLYDPSVEIIAVVTGLASSSGNSKTGDELQTWIMPVAEKPNLAVVTGLDRAVCGTCPLRPLVATGKPCYVRTSEAPRSVWVKGTRDSTERDVLATALSGGYADATEPGEARDWVISRIAGRMLRCGSWGDPASTPRAAWQWLLDVTDGRTGYTHAWQRPRVLREWRGILMASVGSEAEEERALAAGWATFHVTPTVQELPVWSIQCPAAKEAGKSTVCADCGLCDGTPGRSIRIAAH